MRRAVAVVLMMAGLLAVGAWAQATPAADAPASREQVLKLMEALNSHEQIDMMKVLMRSQVGVMVREMWKEQKLNLPDEQRAEAEKALGAWMEKLWDKMPADELIGVMAAAYQKQMTSGEVEAMTAFYCSPAGQSFLKKTPLIMAEYLREMQPIMLRWSKELQEDLTAEMDKIREKYKTDRSAPHADAK